LTVVFDPNQARQVAHVVTLLQENTPVALPTETVYGLAANALNESAVAAVFHLKNRPTFDPLIVHVLDLHKVFPLVREVTELHKQLIEAFWPGPLTLLFEKSEKISDLCTASSSLVALRSPAHKDFRKILEQVDFPLAAPSANRFGRISPVNVQDVLDELGPYGLEAVLDGGPCEHGLESTVVKILKNNSLEIVRLGAISIEEVQRVVGSQVPVVIRESGTGINSEIENTEKNTRALSEAPGQQKSHYAPSRKQLHLFSTTLELTKIDADTISNSVLLLVYPEVENLSEAFLSQWKSVSILSSAGSSKEAAKNLFSTMRSLDANDRFKKIIALEAQSMEGLNLAINDRLRRASSGDLSS